MDRLDRQMNRPIDKQMDKHKKQTAGHADKQKYKQLVESMEVNNTRVLIKVSHTKHRHVT